MKEEKFLRKHKTTLFEAYGVVMKEYVTVPDSLLTLYTASSPVETQEHCNDIFT
jgi:hypothetical protein